MAAQVFTDVSLLFVFLASVTFLKVEENPADQCLAEAKRKAGYVTVNGAVQICMILQRCSIRSHHVLCQTKIG